jgi:hypothetical protein
MLDVILIFGYNANGEIGSDCKWYWIIFISACIPSLILRSVGKINM